MHQVCKSSRGVWVIEKDDDLACDVVKVFAGTSGEGNTSVPLQKGFLISRSSCMEYLRRSRVPPEDFEFEVSLAVRALEKATDSSFGGKDDGAQPLLLSLQVLLPSEEFRFVYINIGLNRVVMQKMANFSGKYNFWLANYVRYLKCYGTVVLRLPVSVYKDVKLKYLGSLVDEPFENMSNSLLESILADYEDITFRNSSDEPWRQLLGTIYGAMNSLARSDDDYAVTFTSPQTQFFCNSGLFVGVAVHSNCGPVSGRGVVYSRNPCTGIKQLSGEYYDCSMTVDSEYCRGIEAPSSMNDLFNRNIQLYSQCQRACDALEGKYRDAQTVEFEVENRRIFIVKSWASSRSPEASVVIVLDLVLEGLITIQEALVRIQPSDVDWISSRYLICLSPVPDSKMQIYNCHVSDSILTLGSGIAVSCGSIVGSLVLCGRAPPNSDGVYILLLDNWNCDMSSTLVLSASGYLCLGGGISSPLACHARKSGKPMITGCSTFMTLSLDGLHVIVGRREISNLEIVSIEGCTGVVALGDKHLECSARFDYLGKLNTLLLRSSSFARFQLIAGVDLLEDIIKARVINGLSGIASHTEVLLKQSQLQREFFILCWILLRSDNDTLKDLSTLIKGLITDNLVRIFTKMFEFGSFELLYFIQLAGFSGLHFGDLSTECLDVVKSLLHIPILSAIPVDPSMRQNALKILVELQILAIGAAAIYEVSMAAINTEINKMRCDSSTFEIFAAIGSGIDCSEVTEIFGYVQDTLSQVELSNHGNKAIRWSVGFILEVPAACVKAKFTLQNVPDLANLKLKGLGVFVFFNIDKLLPLLLGLVTTEEVRELTFISDADRQSLLTLLHDTVAAIREISGGNLVKIGLIGTNFLTVSELSKICLAIDGNIVIEPLRLIAGAILSAAQTGILKEDRF